LSKRGVLEDLRDRLIYLVSCGLTEEEAVAVSACGNARSAAGREELSFGGPA
jgi:hypothetical protein